jgi:hypothetical protein
MKKTMPYYRDHQHDDPFQEVRNQKKNPGKTLVARPHKSQMDFLPEKLLQLAETFCKSKSNIKA